MSKLTLYFTPGSPPARAVLLLIKYLELDVEVKTLDFSKQEQHSSAFLKLNPAHEVPTLVDGDFVLTESRAILQYLANSRKPGSDLYPTDPKLRARVDQRLSYDHVLFVKNGLVVRPVLYTGLKEIPQSAIDGVKDSLKIIDLFLDNSKWIAGDNLTIADFSALTIVTTIVECGYNLTAHVNVNRWYKECQKLPGFEENQKGARGLADRLKAVVGKSLF